MWSCAAAPTRGGRVVVRRGCRCSAVALDGARLPAVVSDVLTLVIAAKVNQSMCSSRAAACARWASVGRGTIGPARRTGGGLGRRLTSAETGAVGTNREDASWLALGTVEYGGEALQRARAADPEGRRPRPGGIATVGPDQAPPPRARRFRRTGPVPCVALPGARR